jgi:hypothetical protein
MVARDVMVGGGRSVFGSLAPPTPPTANFNIDRHLSPRTCQPVTQYYVARVLAHVHATTKILLRCLRYGRSRSLSS